MDDSSNQHGSGARVILEGPNNVALSQSLHFRFKATCNQVKHKALLASLRLAREVGAQGFSYRRPSTVRILLHILEA